MSIPQCYFNGVMPHEHAAKYIHLTLVSFDADFGAPQQLHLPIHPDFGCWRTLCADHLPHHSHPVPINLYSESLSTQLTQLLFQIALYDIIEIHVSAWAEPFPCSNFSIFAGCFASQRERSTVGPLQSYYLWRNNLQCHSSVHNWMPGRQWSDTCKCTCDC